MTAPREFSLVISAGGGMQAIYADDFDFSGLAAAAGTEHRIRRASHVEPTEDGLWTADLGPVGGPTLGPFPKRSEALRAELDWLDEHLGETTA